MAKLLTGKPVAAAVKAALKDLIAANSLQPRMLLIQAGVDPASEFYVQNIVSNGAKLGCEVILRSLPADVSQAQLLDCVEGANLDPSVHGIMIQKPFPAGIDDNLIGSAIDPRKDLDCLNPQNLGKIILEAPGPLPCTPLAALCTLKYYQIPIQGRHVVIIGRSSIVGKPLANLLLWKKPFANASVTVCHSRSQNLAALTQTADILIAAIGKPEFVKQDLVKENCVLLDVGINAVVDAQGKPSYVGDIDFNSCQDKALAITPVPGGIGSVTTSLLFLNLVQACLAAQGVNKNIDDFLGLIFDAEKKEITP